MRSKYLEEKEIEALKKHLRGDWLPYQIGIETGLRVGDIAKLRWEDIQGREIAFVAQKTKKSGIAYITEETARLLRSLRRKTASLWVFPAPSNNGIHISRQVLWKRIKSACKGCRINADGISPHSFRKVYGVREYRAHGLAAAQAGLQHTDISTTEVYTMSDWLTAGNADEPLRRSDIARILHYIATWLGIPIDKPLR